MRRLFLVALGSLLLSASGCRTTGVFDARARGDLAHRVIARWSPSSRLTAAAAIERYGPPDAVAS